MSQRISNRQRITLVGLFAAALTLVLPPPEATAQQPVKAGIVVEITAGRAPVGTMWKSGVQMAVDQINQSGGFWGARSRHSFWTPNRTRRPRWLS